MSTIEIKIAGKGGQGVVVAGEVLAHAAVLDGKEASAVAAYGSEARGGNVTSEVVIGDGEIPAPFVIRPTYLVALSQESYAAELRHVAADTSIFVDSAACPHTESAKNLYRIPALEIASVVVGNPVAVNTAMLGAFAAVTGAVSLESIEAAIREKMKPEAAKLNIEALEEGYKAGRGLLEKPPAS